MNKLKIILSDEADNFLKSQPIKVQMKIAKNIRRVESGIVSIDLFKKLVGSNIWELRTLFNGNYYRLFAFWDTRNEALIIATHGIVKKTDKTPNKEIRKAEAFRKEYFND